MNILQGILFSGISLLFIFVGIALFIVWKKDKEAQDD